MAEMVVIEFEAPQAVRIYNEVNKIIGWEGEPNSDVWPAGLISHSAGSADNKLIVVETWDSQADQEKFMQSALAPAFKEANVPPPTRIEWFSSVMNVHR